MLNDRVDAKEVSDASQLPYSQQISQTIVVTEAGDYTATLQVHGISFDTMTNAEIDGLNRTWLSAIHTALASPNHALWTHIVRTRQKDVVFHIHQPRGAVAAFQIIANVQKVIAVVAQQRGINRPAQHRGVARHPFRQL